MLSIAHLVVAVDLDITGAKGNRLLQTEASHQVVPLWLTIFNEALEGRGRDNDGTAIIRREGRMCRKYYAAYDRCSNILKVL